MDRPIEADAMRRAIALSALGLGSTSPNPPVGCVILNQAGAVVGEGYHERKGEPHAEVNALAVAGARAVGGTAVVTLEPCNHHGRTPPCHQALIDAGVSRVVIAVLDPTSRREGGAARLKAAGLDVEVGVLAEEALTVIGPWLAALGLQRPIVTWGYGVDPGGMTAPPSELVAALRPQCDALLLEDGSLAEGLPGVHGPGAFTLPLIDLSAGVDHALSRLYAHGTRSLLLCGGPVLAGPFLVAGVVDEISVCFRSPSSSEQGPLVPEWMLLPAGFSIRNLRRLHDAVVIEAAAAVSADPGSP